jgi:hypothetical protein
MYLPVEIEAQHQVYESVKHPYDVLVYVYRARVQPRNDYPHGEQTQQPEHCVDQVLVDLFRILHLVHDDVVGPEKGYDV